MRFIKVGQLFAKRKSTPTSQELRGDYVQVQVVAVKRLQVGIGAKLFGGICAVYRRRTSFLLFLKGGIEAIIDNRVVQRVFPCFFFL